MKCYIALIFISTICLSLAVSVVKVKNSKNALSSKVKSEGSGDYATGFFIPGILIAKGNENFDENKKLHANAKFKPISIETTPTDDDKLGWCFEMSDPTDEGLKSFMLKGKSTWCIPYRLITSKFVYDNSYGKLKSITCNVTVERLVYKLKILLPYKLIGWFITDDEAEKISSAANVNSAKAIGSITIAKSSIYSAASSLNINNILVLTASRPESLKSHQLTMNKDILLSEAIVKNYQTRYDSTTATIIETESKLNQLKKTQNEIKIEVQTQITKLENMKQALSLIPPTFQPDELQTLVKNYKKVVDTNLKKFNDSLNDLKALAPPRNNDLESLRKSYQYNLKDLITNLDKYLSY